MQLDAAHYERLDEVSRLLLRRPHEVAETVRLLGGDADHFRMPILPMA
ncbi:MULTISPECIES: hypothetical protein [Streptomyces]|uniref:Uncharacterized protein n=1 Tax=Streptomyces spinosisporus TaxID=2927582 RepID=A0ABS9XTB7_9ACTN|nr:MULTISPECIES: hypothetical protein [Streptomyces]MCI3244122.1 hypothetical protein [Streptomyces spinosisporus]WUB41031.1 hypothetical protein OHN38_41300 [Streptomyces sp. NBC_00588]